MIRFKPLLAILVMLLAVGCSKPAGDSQDGASSDATQVTFNVEGMTWPTGWGIPVREALESLPGVDKAVVTVGENGSAVCSVNSKFDEKEAVATIEGVGAYKASKAAAP